jgi:hypothetical protein
MAYIIKSRPIQKSKKKILAGGIWHPPDAVNYRLQQQDEEGKRIYPPPRIHKDFGKWF